jgi:serine/threonine protein kinase
LLAKRSLPLKKCSWSTRLQSFGVRVADFLSSETAEICSVSELFAMTAVPRIPGYEIVTSLGGGMLSAVYAARDQRTDVPCAIKVLRPDWHDRPIAVKLLQREARAALAVAHPHLVKLLDCHVLMSPHFLVMEMLPGEPLRQRLRRDYRLDVSTALWIARQTAEALSALHRKGFIHGDVKPDNVHLVADGKAVLLDLGFAHRPGENASLIESGYLLGTVDYLAPELCGPASHGEDARAEDPRNDDPRSDLFSLGAALHEMLTGRLPYDAGPALESMRRRRVESPRIVQDTSGWPPGLAELLGRLLAFYPEDRPHAAGLVHELIALEIRALGRRRAG